MPKLNPPVAGAGVAVPGYAGGWPVGCALGALNIGVVVGAWPKLLVAVVSGFGALNVKLGVAVAAGAAGAAAAAAPKVPAPKPVPTGWFVPLDAPNEKRAFWSVAGAVAVAFEPAEKLKPPVVEAAVACEDWPKLNRPVERKNENVIF